MGATKMLEFFAAVLVVVFILVASNALLYFAIEELIT
jgi:hypothetical protein